MFVNIVLSILIIGCVIYLVLGYFFISSLMKLKIRKSYEKKTVSVCIAARNESKNLRKLLTSLVNQTYPTDLFEVIIADDLSEDNSRKIIREYSSRYSYIKLLEVNNRAEVISPKKNALSNAISISKGEIILTTDADCIVPPTWIESMVSAFYDKDVSLVAGYSEIDLPDWHKASLLHKFEYYDFAALYSAVIGSYALGEGYTCIGQNLAYTREAFDKVGGFEQIKHLISGDDVNLMQIMKKAGLKNVFNFDKASFVKTARIVGWKQLLNQRSRWAWNVKWQAILRPFFFWSITAVMVYYTAGFVLFFLNWKYALIQVAVRTFIEISLFLVSFKYLNVKRSRLLFYPIWAIMMPLLYIITVPMGYLNLFEWYGKKPNKVTRLKRT